MSEKQHIVFPIILAFYLFSLPCLSLSEERLELKKQAGEWRANNIHLVGAISRLSSNPTTSTKEVVYLIESWDETTIHTFEDIPESNDYTKDGVKFLGKGIKSSSGFNPELKTFPIDAHNKNREEVLNDVTESHGSFIWEYDPKNRVVNVIEKHLKNDPRWPLNWPLDKDAETTLTLLQARGLLHEKFHLYLSPKKDYSKEVSSNKIVWESTKTANSKARDLVNSIVRVIYTPGHFYHAKINIYFDPRLGYEGLKERNVLQWVLLRYKSATSLKFLKYLPKDSIE